MDHEDHEATPDARLSLREITLHNWLECVRLAVSPEQERWVATNAFSLAEAAYRRDLVPLAIYAAERMIGFTMHQLAPGRAWIFRLMVVPEHQRKGIGRWAMNELLKRFRARGDITEVFIDFVEGNDVSEQLYSSLGFRRTGEVIHQHDVVMRLPLQP